MTPHLGGNVLADDQSSSSDNKNMNISCEENEDAAAPALMGGGASYWDAPVENVFKCSMGKTLSTLDFSALESNHPEEKIEEKKVKADSYWDAPPESELQGKTLSTLDLSTLESNGIVNAPETGASYWDDQPLDKALQGKTLSQVEMSTMGKQHPDETSNNITKSPSFWDWQVEALKKSVSKLSMSNLRKGSANDHIEDDKRDDAGPITNKVHKIRNSWRKSFQRLSTNSLAQLDESQKKGSKGSFNRLFKSKNSLDISGGSRASQASIDEDAIMF
mmetsp:Transcript_3116/g.3511  ORF Transcript_3116/g.3511 Transcript_3116/m.3511 type:complete len:276 (-) Transcript_3116:278-1105(-)